MYTVSDLTSNLKCSETPASATEMKILFNTLFVLVTTVLTLVAMDACRTDVSREEKAPVTTSGIDEINAAIAADPGDASNYARRAEYHVSIGNFGDAITDMAEAMRRDSTNEQYHILLTDIYLNAARSQLALGTMERAAILFPDSVRTLNKLAEVNLIVRQYGRASSILQEAMKLDPRNTATLHLVGILYQEEENIERAIQTYQTIVEIDSEDADAWITLGNLLQGKEDPMALRCFENAIRVNPGYPQALHAKAFYLQNHGSIQEAIKIYDQIHGIDPDYTDAWLNQGILFLEVDSLDAALGCFETLVNQDPRSVIGLYYLGLTYQTQGDTVLARQYYSTGLTLAPGSRRLLDAMASTGITGKLVQ